MNLGRLRALTVACCVGLARAIHVSGHRGRMSHDIADGCTSAHSLRARVESELCSAGRLSLR